MEEYSFIVISGKAYVWPYAAVDTLDGMIGKRNRIHTRLIQQAREKTSERGYGPLQGDHWDHDGARNRLAFNFPNWTI